MATITGHRRRRTFRPRSLLLLAVTCTVAVVWWLQREPAAGPAVAQERTRWLESEPERREAINHVLHALDHDDPDHQRAFELLRFIKADSPLDFIQRSSTGGLDVLVYNSDSYSVPGIVDTVAVLLRGQEAVDVISRESNTRVESHEVELRDVNHDGSAEVVIDCHPGPWSRSEPFTLAYEITSRGFSQID